MTLNSINQYGHDFQIKVLSSLLTHKDFLTNIHDIISDEYFENSAQKWIIKEMKRRKLKVGDNEPYEGNLIGDTMYKHGLKNNLHHTLIEVRNDLLSSSTKIHRVSVLLKQVINNSINRI